MLRKPNMCGSCSLEKIGKGFCEPGGSGALPVLIVGEAPGEAEIRDGFPFRPDAQAGSMLHTCVKRAGYDMSQFVATNLVNCAVPNFELGGTRYEHSAIAHCRQAYFLRIVERYQPKVILALGSLPLKHLTGMSGEKRGIKELRGYFLPDALNLGIPVIASYHPSHIRRGETKLIPLLMQDITKAVMMAKGELREGFDYILNPLGHPSLSRYEEHPTLDRARAFLEECRRDPSRPISFDIENPKVKEDENKRVMVDQPISQIQFSIEPWTGIAFPWVEGYREVAAEILALPNPKVSFNGWYYDQKVLARNGVQVTNHNFDMMFAAQLLYSDLPKGLQSVSSWLGVPPWLVSTPWKVGFPFAWKHLTGADFQLYGIADADATLRLYHSLLPEIERRGHMETYRKQFHERIEIMARVTERGICIDRKAQLKFREQLTEAIAKLQGEIKALAPQELRKPGNAKGKAKADGYKKPPKEVAEALAAGQPVPEGWEQCEFPKMVTVPCEPCGGKKGTKECIVCGGKGKTEGQGEELELRWTKLTEFNGMSSEQVKAYIRLRKHPMPKHLKTKEDSTGKEGLSELYAKTGDPMYQALLDLRLQSKMMSSFVGENCDWNPGPDGKVHPVFMPLTGSGQWISKAPNAQNFPAHGNLSVAFSRTLCASRGCKLISLDFSGFHTITQAFEADDPAYLRLARLDMHSFITARKLSIPGSEKWLDLPDAELEKLLKGIKKVHGEERSKSKSAVFGRQFGQTDRAFYAKHKASFDPSDTEAEEFLARNLRLQVYDPLTKKRVMLQSHPPERRVLLAKMYLGLGRVQELFRAMDELFPKVYKEYPVRVMNEAHLRGYLDSRHGFRRYFMDIYKWNSKKGALEPGMDADKCKAYLPSNDAHGWFGLVMLELEQNGWNDKYRLSNFIHDSIVFDCPNKFVAECLLNVSRVMQKPNPVLISDMVPGGLTCQVEAKVGLDLSRMKVVDLEKLERGQRR